MSDQLRITRLSCDQIIHLINETHETIWEDDTIEVDIDFRTLRYVINRLKGVFLKALDDEPQPNVPTIKNII